MNIMTKRLDSPRCKACRKKLPRDKETCAQPICQKCVHIFGKAIKSDFPSADSKLVEFSLDLYQGRDPADLFEELVDKGATESEAEQLVDDARLMKRTVVKTQAARAMPKSCLTALVGGSMLMVLILFFDPWQPWAVIQRDMVHSIAQWALFGGGIGAVGGGIAMFFASLLEYLTGRDLHGRLPV